jgi:hypothetical protein
VHGRALQVTVRIPATRSVVTCRACSHVWAGIDGARDLAAEITGKRRSA